MLYRTLGKTNLNVSVLGFGCGAVGGLLVRGEYPQMRRTVARAIELGVNYFDTASMYGNGQSEVNLGAVLRELGAQVIVGTKVRLAPNELGDIEAATLRSVEGSLRRLGRDSVDLIQFHNRIGATRQADQVTIHDLAIVLNTLQKLRQQGKVRHWGITALGETDVLHQVVGSGDVQTIQACYNLLNPSAGNATTTPFPFQDYRQLIDHAARQNVGVIVIRMLAAGALSGALTRHPLAAQSVEPISSSADLAADVARAQAFNILVAEGHCENLIEAAIRFVISHNGVSTALVGISSLEQFELAATYAKRGPLSAEGLKRISEVWKRGV